MGGEERGGAGVFYYPVWHYSPTKVDSQLDAHFGP